MAKGPNGGLSFGQSLIDYPQKIEFQGNESSNTYKINSRNVSIFSSKNSLQSFNNSSEIKFKTISNYVWNECFTNGELISFHRGGFFYAFSFLTDFGGKVRLFHRKVKKEKKFFLPPFTGPVVDLSFAHDDREVLLGCIEETGSVQIFKITLGTENEIK